MKFKHRLIVVSTLLIIIAAATLAPRGGTSSQTAKKPYQRAGNDGTISGTVFFFGKPKPNPRIDMSADPVCVVWEPNARTEWLIVRNQRLANVLVYIKDGAALEHLLFETPNPPVVLNQQNCRFIPHVLGIQTNQILTILNSDPTTHNVHATSRNSPDWNQSQPPGAAALIERFAQPDFVIIKCNQHPWMYAYVSVLANPFFTVSDDEGAFRIEGLPPGTYTIAARHERLGEKTAKITITRKAESRLNFAFDGKDSWWGAGGHYSPR